jgi:hypothetical protein
MTPTHSNFSDAKYSLRTVLLVAQLLQLLEKLELLLPEQALVLELVLEQVQMLPLEQLLLAVKH